MPFNIGPGELIIVLIIALIVVGPGKLPDVGAALGKSIREFRRAAADVKDSTSLEPAAPPPAATAAQPQAAPAQAPAAPAPNTLVGAATPNALSAEPGATAATDATQPPSA